MEGSTVIYEAMRGHKQRSFAQAAPVGAKFEDCLQSFSRLCVALRGTSTPSILTQAEDNHGKLLAWGNDTGASSQSLDHTLRKASDLRDRALELLTNLHFALVDGTEDLRDAAMARDERAIEDISGRMDAGEHISMPESSPTLDIDISGLVGYIDGIMKCLINLIPNLRDPFPRDVYSQDASPKDEFPDIDLAKSMFPHATVALVSRLGRANWKRRKYLKSVQERAQSGTAYGRARKSQKLKHQKKSPLRQIAVDAFNFQKPALKSDSLKIENKLQVTEARSISSTTAPPSVIESVFSKAGLTRAESMTSFAPSEVPLRQRSVPKPPVPLDQGKSFLCPYCNDAIDVGVRVSKADEWDLHVFGDLEPYLCTFDDCLRAEKTYGAREEWYRHELDNHRVMKVWVCQLCGPEFTSAQAFELHLQEKHGNISPSQLPSLVALCLKHSQKSIMGQTCPLCAMHLKAESVQDHIASHMEQLALTSVDGDESSEEDDKDDIVSLQFDDTASEGRTKLQILDAFVEEQLGFIPAAKLGPPDAGIDESNLDFVGDSDDEDSGVGAQRPQPSNKRPGDESRDWRIAKLLGKSAPDQTHIGQGQINRSRSPKPSQSSNAHDSVSFPTVRTASFPRDYDFVGRLGDLANLYKILSDSGRLCIVSGTGGIGKTATAVEYTYRYEQSYNCVFWVQAETRVGAADTFSLIATQLNLNLDGSIDDQEQLIDLGREFLEKTEKRWLMVFDNVNDWSDIEEYIPVKLAKTNGSILITTRIVDLGPKSIVVPSNFHRLDFKELTMEEGRMLLIQGIQPELRQERVQLHPEWRLAGEIASLAGLPLAISHISGYVKAAGVTLAEFLELWNEWSRNSLPAGATDNMASSSYSALETIWNIGLRDLGVDALKLLKIIAFLDSDVIQKELLINDHTDPGLQFLHSSKVIRCRRMVNELSSRRLIAIKKQETREVLSVHRLLQHRVIQDLDLDAQERDEIFGLAFELVRQRLPRPSIDTRDPSKWNLFKEYLPHVLSLQRVYAAGLSSITPFVGLAELFRDGGVLLWQRGMFNDACRLLNSAETILENLESDDDQLKADIHVATSLCIQYFGISHRAESRDRNAQILEMRQKLAANPNLSASAEDNEWRMNHAFADYANSLLQFNDYKEAEPIYKQCYEKYLKMGGEDVNPFECAKLYHHLAYCRMYQRDFEGAIELAEKAIKLVSSQAGDVQLTLRFRFDLACIILQKGDVKQSLEIQRQILDARLSLQGRASYFTLQSYYAVGALNSYLGKLDEAENWMRIALARAQERPGQNFWPDSAVARTQFHLSQILTENNKYPAEASRLAGQATAVLSRLLPFDPLEGVVEEDRGALFDHLQPVFGGRFTGLSLLKYVS